MVALSASNSNYTEHSPPQAAWFGRQPHRLPHLLYRLYSCCSCRCCACVACLPAHRPTCGPLLLLPPTPLCWGMSSTKAWWLCGTCSTTSLGVSTCGCTMTQTRGCCRWGAGACGGCADEARSETHCDTFKAIRPWGVECLLGIFRLLVERQQFPLVVHHTTSPA